MGEIESCTMTKFVLFQIEYRDVAKTALFKPSIPFDIEFQFCDITCYRHDHWSVITDHRHDLIKLVPRDINVVRKID